MAATMSIVAVVCGGLGWAVRGGRRWAIITALVANAAMLILMIYVVYNALANPQAGGFFSAILALAITALMGLLMQRLILSAKSAAMARLLAMQWQMARQFGDGQGGFPFSAPLPPPPEEKK
jgi:uncharacterized membrane-anchored protein